MADALKVRFFMSSNPVTLRNKLAEFKSTVGIETEYGDEVVEGTLTMAHHGSRAGQPAPCSYPNGCADDAEAVGLSHLDEDSIGGCAAVTNSKPEAESFWKLVEFVDVNGAHKIKLANASEQDIRRLYAFHAWIERNKVNPNSDGFVSDVTDDVYKAIKNCNKIVQDDLELLTAGDEFRANEIKLNTDSFIKSEGGVIFRRSDMKVNHLYTTPSKEIMNAVVTYKPTNGGITVSFADKPRGLNAINILKKLFGDKAGGHASIAGSPRGVRMEEEDAEIAFQSTIEANKLNLK